MDEVLTLDERAALAAENKYEAECLLEEFSPFVNALVDRYTGGRNVAYRDEMRSIALLAFHEAIGGYDRSKGHFYAFVSTVIRRRLIDCLRRVYRSANQTLSYDGWDYEEDPGSAQSEMVARASVAAHEDVSRQSLLAEEIAQFRAELETWGVTLDALVKASPKHGKLREQYKSAVKTVAADSGVMQTIQVKRYFPVTKVSEITAIPKKKVERARTYIIASLIILTGDYDFLAEYIH